MSLGNALDLEWFEMAAGQRFDLHVHAKHQLAWASAGAVLVEVADRCWVLPPHLALWIPAGTWHGAVSVRPSLLLGIYLDVEASPIDWQEPTVVAVSPLARHLIEYLDSGLDTPEWSRASAVLEDLLVPVDIASLEVPLPVDARAQAVAEILLSDPSESRGLDELARLVHSSSRTLLRLFLTETGLTFSDWRARVRMQAAVALLAEQHPVSVVARRVGYANPSAFVAAFHRVVGEPPAGYIERLFVRKGHPGRKQVGA